MKTMMVVAAIVAVAMGCATAAGAITGDEMCKAMHWPMPMPYMVGWALSHTDTVTDCFDNVTATTPDGHDAENDPANIAYTWKITSQTPAAGTMVPIDQKIALTVVRDLEHALP